MRKHVYATTETNGTETLSVKAPSPWISAQKNNSAHVFITFFLQADRQLRAEGGGVTELYCDWPLPQTGLAVARARTAAHL